HKQDSRRAIFLTNYLSRNRSSSRIKHRYSLVHSYTQRHRRLDHVFALDVQWIVDNDRLPVGLCVQAFRDCFGRTSQHTRKLIHRDHVVVPGKVERFRRRRARQYVVKLPAHHERPSVVQTLQRIGAIAQPHRADRRSLRRVSKQLVLSVPAFLISLGRDRTGRVIRQQQIAFVTRQSFDLIWTNVEKHLLRCRRDNCQWSIVSSYDLFQHAHRIFTRRTACVASAVIVIVSKNTTGFSVSIDAARPINRIVSRDRGAPADVFPDLSAITSRIQRGDHTATVRSLPIANVPRNTTRCFFNRTWTTNTRRRVPRELLCRETLDARVREYAQQRSRKTKTVGQHVLRARLAKLTFKEAIAVKNLSKDRLRRRGVDVALLHRRARRKPATRRDVLLHARVVSGPVFLHHSITIRAAEVEDVVRILLEEREVVVHRLRKIFVDDARILPAPLRVEMRVTDDVERRLAAEIGLG